MKQTASASTPSSTSAPTAASSAASSSGVRTSPAASMRSGTGSRRERGTSGAGADVLVVVEVAAAAHPAAHLEHVAEALGGEQAGLRRRGRSAPRWW